MLLSNPRFLVGILLFVLGLSWSLAVLYRRWKEVNRLREMEEILRDAQRLSSLLDTVDVNAANVGLTARRYYTKAFAIANGVLPKLLPTFAQRESLPNFVPAIRNAISLLEQARDRAQEDIGTAHDWESVRKGWLLHNSGQPRRGLLLHQYAERCNPAPAGRNDLDAAQ